MRAFEPLARETFGTRFAIDANSGSDARHAALLPPVASPIRLQANGG